MLADVVALSMGVKTLPVPLKLISNAPLLVAPRGRNRCSAVAAGACQNDLAVWCHSGGNVVMAVADRGEANLCC